MLLDTLEFNGIIGIFHLLIKSYLHERLQRMLIYNTVVHDKVSYCNWEEVKCGFPQGCIDGS
jgi:hypothetical protein